MNAQQLRNSILQEAICGRLVPQDPNDEPASVLLERIREEKKRLVKAGKLKKKDLEETPISEDEIPFAIPDSWKWVRFGTITINRDSERIPLSVDERRQLTKTYDYYGASGVIDKVDRYLFDKPLLLIGEDGANLINRSTPIAFIAKGKYWVNNHAHVLDYYNEDLMQYVCWYINAISLVDYVTGTAQPKMNQEKMNSIMVALPPLAEQMRIVAKIEELLPKVEEYGKAQDALDKLNEELPERLKKSVLQEAISGKLVPQDPNDEPASVLLNRIREEKKRLVKEGKLKKKDLEETPISEDEIPFDIPDSWEWVRLGEITYNHGQKKPSEAFSYIDIGSIDNKKQRLNQIDSIVEAKDAPSRARKIVERGDILYSTVRPYLHNMCVIDRDFIKEPIASTGFAVLSCFSGVYNRFLFYYLLSPIFDSYANNGDNAKGVAYPAINDEKLYKGVIPLPPLAEQKRIVAKIEEAFKAIDALS